MVRLIFSVLFLFALAAIVSCKEKGDETFKQEPIENTLVKEDSITLKLTGFDNRSIWELYVSSNDSILLIEKDIKDSANINAIVIQNLGLLEVSKRYSNELVLSSALVACLNKSDLQYLDSDTIPIIIDSLLLNKNFNWELKYLDTSINITETPFFHQRYSDNRVFLTFNPNTNIGYKPFTISEIGKRSSLYISKTGHPNTRFYLDKNENKYNMVIEKVIDKKENYYSKEKNDTIVKRISLDSFSEN
jgi:hypothetical protein